jgi:hypothetical protein
MLLLAALGGTDCEHIGSGWLAQPANAVSALTYVAVGGWLLRRAAGRQVDRVLLVAAGTAMAAVGLASGAYHGPQPAWAGPAHDWSIAWLVVVTVGLTIERVARLSWRRAAAVLTRRWWAAGACWAAALAAYAVGRTGSRLCQPESVWQPHAAWHVLGALGLGVAILAFTGRPGLSTRSRVRRRRRVRA